MSLPAIICLLIFNYAPMGGLIMAFQDLDLRKGIFRSPFIGFRNFEFLFTTTDAWRITRNTLCYNIVFIIVVRQTNLQVFRQDELQEYVVI